ncbi:MAG: hypothetical protein WC758_03880 [Candidatus Woesearchaeota archaeon]
MDEQQANIGDKLTSVKLSRREEEKQVTYAILKSYLNQEELKKLETIFEQPNVQLQDITQHFNIDKARDIPGFLFQHSSELQKNIYAGKLVVRIIELHDEHYNSHSDLGNPQLLASIIPDGMCNHTSFGPLNYP